MQIREQLATLGRELGMELATKEDEYLVQRIRSFWLHPHTLRLARKILVFEKQQPIDVERIDAEPTTSIVVTEKVRVNCRIKGIGWLFLRRTRR